jgi:hypothetical protein
VTGPDKQVRVFRSFQEADDADRAFYRSLTLEQLRVRPRPSRSLAT